MRGANKTDVMVGAKESYHTFMANMAVEQRRALHFCWHIHKGFKKDVSPERIKEYANWYWSHYLKKYFEESASLLERKAAYIELLDKKRITSSHKKLKVLFEDQTNVIRNLRKIEEMLEQVVRLERKVFFSNEEQLLFETLSLSDEVDLFSLQFNDVFWEEE